MLPEISLNILDIAQNSISANAKLISILVETEPQTRLLTVRIADDGKGMSEEMLAVVTDPFFTTRTTRDVGLGIPFFKQAAECTGGAFSISSEVGKGTTVTAQFHTDNIDCMPLGDINATVHELVTMNSSVDFLYQRRNGEKEFTLDTREMREILGGVPFDTPDVSIFIREFLEENEMEVQETGTSS